MCIYCKQAVVVINIIPHGTCTSYSYYIEVVPNEIHKSSPPVQFLVLLVQSYSKTLAYTHP